MAKNGFLSIGGQQLTDRYDPRLWGTAGNLWANDTDTAADRDQRYWMRVKNPGDDSGSTQWQLRPEIAQHLNGRVQVGSAGVGGAGEVIDPSRMEYDPTYGYLTRPENIKTPQNSGLSNFLADNMTGIVAALANPAIAMGSGSMFQAGGMLGPGGWDGSFGAGGLDPETMAGAGGMGSPVPPVDIPGPMANIPPSTAGDGFLGSFQPVEVPPLMEGVSSTPTNMMQVAPSIAGEGLAGAGGGGFWSNLGAGIAANPLRAISTGLQVGGLLGGAIGGGGVGGGSGGASRPSGGLLGGSMGQVKRPQWKPNQYTMGQLQSLYPGRY